MWPDATVQTGLVCVCKRQNVSIDGTWNVWYGSRLLKGALANEAAADTVITNLMAFLNTTQTASAKTVAQIEALA
jgi:hypothetical protein